MLSQLIEPTYCSTFHLLLDVIIIAVLNTEPISVRLTHTHTDTRFLLRQLALMLALPYRLQAMLVWLVGLRCISSNIFPLVCVCGCARVCIYTPVAVK